MPSLALIW